MARRRRWAKGRRARAICQRTGFEIPYRYLVQEPGTKLWVDKRWNDGRWNRVDHPQNFSPTDLVDELPLRFATKGTEFTPQIEVNILSEVSLPSGGGIIVETALASTTITDLADHGTSINMLMVDASTTLAAEFVFYEFNQIENI